MMRGLLPLFPSGTMNTAAPDGATPRRNGDYQKKYSLMPMPRRGPETGDLRIQDDFHDSGVNRIDSCLFLQNLKITPTIIVGTAHVPSYQF
jgi:hypothetical protein